MFCSKSIICWVKEWVRLGSPFIHWIRSLTQEMAFTNPLSLTRGASLSHTATLLPLKNHSGAQWWGNIKFTFLLLWHSTKKMERLLIDYSVCCASGLVWAGATTLCHLLAQWAVCQPSAITCHTRAQVQYFLYGNGFECSLPRKKIQTLVTKFSLKKVSRTFIQWNIGRYKSFSQNSNWHLLSQINLQSDCNSIDTKHLKCN